jgi:hypothetical protein
MICRPEGCKPAWMWLAIIAIVIALLVFDLGVGLR